MKIKLNNIALMILLWVWMGVMSQAQATPKAATEHVPLSQVNYACVPDVPVFGSIDWTVNRLPFVPSGPDGGMNGMAMVAHEGKVYLFGGHIPAGENADPQAEQVATEEHKPLTTSRRAYCYDPATQQWSRLADMPGRREYVRAIRGDDAVYVVGGASYHADGYEARADCFKLELTEAGGTWKSCGDLSVPRTHMGVARVGNFLIVAGGNKYDADVNGYHRSTIQGVTDVFDLNQPESGWQSKAPIPGYSRGWAAAAACGKYLYLSGGIRFDDESNAFRIRETLRYDPVADSWEQRARPPLAISGWEAGTFADRYIIAAGGVVGSVRDPAAVIWNDLVFVYDTKDDCWYKIDSPLPPGGIFNDAGVCIIGDTIYVAGAEGPKTDKPRGDRFNYFLIGRIEPFFLHSRPQHLK